MESSQLDHLRSFHRHLVALQATGTPLDVGVELGDAESGGLEARLHQIESRLELCVKLGQTVEEALTADEELPTVYRCTALTLLASGDTEAALDTVSRHAGAAPAFRRSLVQSLIPSAIIGVLVYGGLIGLCLYTAPRFEDLYRQIEAAPSFSLRVLGWLQAWLPVWSLAAPVSYVVVAVWATCRADWPLLLRWAPAMNAFRCSLRRASFADLLSRLSENHLPLELAAPLAEQRSVELGWKGGTEAFLAAFKTPSSAGKASMPSKSSLQSKPPASLLRWSLADSEDHEQLIGNLRFAADVYRHAAYRRARYWNAVGTMFAGALISGVMLLAYGWALFAPFASLMEDVSQASSFPEIQSSRGSLVQGGQP